MVASAPGPRDIPRPEASVSQWLIVPFGLLKVGNPKGTMSH